MNNLGGFAQLGDALFRGYMRGKATKTVNDAIKFKKQDDAYQAAYNVAAQNLKSLHDQGVDPNSDQYKQAQAAVNASWNSLMQFRAQHIPGMDDPGMRGKKKKNKQNKEAAANPLQGLMSNDPNEKMTSAYDLMMKMGPPVYFQLGDQKRMAQAREAQDLQTQNTIDAEKQQHRVFELQSKPADQRTEAEQRELTELTTKPVQPRPGDEKLKAQDAVYKKLAADPNYQLSDNERMILGANPKSKLHYDNKNGEIIEETTSPDGTTSFQVVRKGTAATPQAKPIPPGTTGKWQKDKDDAIAYARQLWLMSDDDAKKAKVAKISYDEFIQRWQQAQNTFEDQYKTAGHPTPHVVIKDNVDKNGNWTGAAMPSASAPATRTAFAGGNSSTAVSDIPPEAASQLKEGTITTFGNGSRWTLRNGKPEQLSPGGQP